MASGARPAQRRLAFEAARVVPDIRVRLDTAALVSASAPLGGSIAPPASSVAIPCWALFVLFAAAGIASLVFGVLNPELIFALLVKTRA